jgi:hypothetical protein
MYSGQIKESVLISPHYLNGSCEKCSQFKKDQDPGGHDSNRGM